MNLGGARWRCYAAWRGVTGYHADVANTSPSEFFQQRQMSVPLHRDTKHKTPPPSLRFLTGIGYPTCVAVAMDGALTPLLTY